MRIVAVLIAAACAALSLCGAGTAASARQSDYRAQVRPVERQLSGVLVALRNLAAKSIVYPAPPDSAVKAAGLVDRQRATLRSAGGRLGAISPPASNAAVHAQLKSAAQLLNTQLGKATKRLRKGWLIDAAKLPRLTGAQQLGAALAAMARNGFAVGSG